MPSLSRHNTRGARRALALAVLLGTTGLVPAAFARGAPGADAVDPRTPYDPYAQGPSTADGAPSETMAGDQPPAPRRPQRPRAATPPPEAADDAVTEAEARAPDGPRPAAQGPSARRVAANTERDPEIAGEPEDAAVQAPTETPAAVAGGRVQAALTPEPAARLIPVSDTPEARERAPRPQGGAAFSRRIMESASAYLRYLQKVRAISASYSNGEGVASDVKVGAAYEARQFQEGTIAAAAIVALQDRAFVEGVNAATGEDPGRARLLADQILANPAAVLAISGSDTAAARASAALRRQGDRLLETGLRVKRASYEVQHQSWSKGDIAAPEARLAGAKTLSSARLSPPREETEKLLKVVLAEEGAAPLLSDRSASPVVVRALALAALAVVGEAGQSGGDRLASLLTEERQGECLKMAKLNLFQCLAVAGPHYEDLFCLGQHALMDTAQCVIAASGVGHPVTTASIAPAARPMSAPSEDYWVPVGGNAERTAAPATAPAAAPSENATR